MHSKPEGEHFAQAVAKFLRVMIDIEAQNETKKIQLLENHLFNPYVAYQYFDVFGQGYCTRADMKRFFAKYSFDVTEAEIDYMMYRKGKISEYSVNLNRPDCFFYEHFLNMMTPANMKKLTDNLSSNKNQLAGKAQLLPSYVFDQFLDCLSTELKTFNSIYVLQRSVIDVYGYSAAPAFKMIAGEESETMSFYNLKIFLETYGYSLTQNEYRMILSLHQTDKQPSLSKSDFLNLFTPFDKTNYYNVGDRRYNLLTGERNSKNLNDYLSNAYMYQAPKKEVQESDPRLKEVAHIMQNLLTNQKEVDAFAKKDLRVNQDGKILYDLTKKNFPYASVRGFKDCFDDYHKNLYRETKENTHDFLLKEDLNSLKAQKLFTNKQYGAQPLYSPGPAPTTNVRGTIAPTEAFERAFAGSEAISAKNQQISAIRPVCTLNTNLLPADNISMLKGFSINKQ